MEHSVFISYSSADKNVADQICAALEEAGQGCWIAPRDIEPGADYPSAILSGLHGAQLIVAVISETAIASPHILTEIGHAFSEKKPIVPFRLSNLKLPPNFDYFLSTSQWLDAHDGCTPENLARLKEAVAQELANRTASPVMQAVARDKRVPLAAGAVVLLLIVGAFFYWRQPAAPAATGDPPKPANPLIASTETTAKPQPWVNPKDGLTYVWIPKGTFMMGCSPGDSECKSDESPTHLVELPEGFWIGQTEVTNAAYHRLVPSASFSAEEAKLPVIGLSRMDAKSYCTAIGGRLPTEAEWEYAARGGTPGPYFGVPSKIAWYAANSGDKRHEVATLQANPYGLFDMLGNASEWVADRYYNKYDIEAPAIGEVEQPLASNATAVTRGGFWESEAAGIRVSRRVEAEKDDPAPMAGVRCVADRK
jgi:formylglycine-generating enzyme required for sulfatase activity